MNKKLVKILSIMLMVIMISSISLNVLALTPGDIKGSGSVTGETEITNIGKSVVGILQTVGIVLSVIILIVLGIKYMMGSAEEKADYKKSMMPYIVGAALIFAASALAQVIYQLFSGVSTT